MLAKLNLPFLISTKKRQYDTGNSHEIINQQIQIPNSLFILTCVYGLQAEQTYSKIGLTIVW